MERFKLSPCGRWMGIVGSGRKGGGLVNIMDAVTCQWVAQVRVEGKGGVADFEWWGDGEGMVVIGKGGEAVEWSGLDKRVLGRWIDEGAVGTTVMTLGGKGTGDKALGGDRWVAVGSQSGVVNIYDRRGWLKTGVAEKPNPTRVLDQLTTPVSHLEFSENGQLLVMASRWKRDALKLGELIPYLCRLSRRLFGARGRVVWREFADSRRLLVHLPSCTVYRNWPTSNTPLGRITAVGFGPGSDALVVGNEQGKIRMWEIRS